LDRAGRYKELFAELLNAINDLYKFEGLKDDPTLRDGIINYLIPILINILISSVPQGECGYFNGQWLSGGTIPVRSIAG
jgi:hypothetical protein